MVRIIHRATVELKSAGARRDPTPSRRCRGRSKPAIVSDGVRMITRTTAVVAAALGVLQAEARVWTSTTGKTVEAEFVGMQGTSVTLQTPDGRRVGIAIGALSAADQDFLLTKPKPGGAAAPAATGAGRAQTEILAEIAKAGATPPAWWASVQMRTPSTLDLTGTYRPKAWEPQKAYGAYFWSVINPNPQRWREGIKLHAQAMDARQKDKDALLQCMTSLADAYLRYEKDHARAAHWWNRAIQMGWSPPPEPAAGLAECYFRLGSARMASETLLKYSSVCGAAVKLLAEMGETDRAIQMAGQMAQSMPEAGHVYAGNVCRLAGDLPRAVSYYEKALAVKSGGRRLQQYQQRARDAIRAIELYDKLDVARVKDGTFHGSGAGYRGPVDVAVKVEGGRITETRITRHKEDDYFFHLTVPELPGRIVKANTVKGIDTITGATVTGEAILNASAQALRSGMD
jgi:uncharacterized protein with FMN-binding domain